jgi:hypothetical protein
MDDELTPDSSGVWLVTTASGSSHIWNLNAGTVTRMPTGWAPERLANDGDGQSIIGVMRFPRVGESSAFVLEGDHVNHARLRLTTAVTRIERVN